MTTFPELLALSDSELRVLFYREVLGWKAIGDTLGMKPVGSALPA